MIRTTILVALLIAGCRSAPTTDIRSDTLDRTLRAWVRRSVEWLAED